MLELAARLFLDLLLMMAGVFRVRRRVSSRSLQRKEMEGYGEELANCGSECVWNVNIVVEVQLQSQVKSWS